ncbi:hypothetical protein FRC04_003472 [Tulasnella sp. 424]|nr:hypothetical protein FRC04_003472 [Tulasnella sp. 424]KAG8965736.1 hypothetical protein FRC05_003053 [Tulasnella sp. 425]
MSDSLLSKRLDRALDAAQYLTQVFPDNPDFATTGTGDVVKTGTIGLVNLPTWTEKNLKSALRRQTLKESLGMEDIEREERERTTGKIGPPPNLDPFHTLRSLIPILGEEVDGGSKEVMVEDAEPSHAMFIKVAEVRKLDDRTPLLVVQFRLDGKSPQGEYAFWNYASTGRLTGLQCSTRSLMLLHRLLSLNSGRVPTDSGYKTAHLKASFILPVGPIEKADIARLTRDLSCAVCGKQSKTRCAQCQSTHYCSPECQKGDWAIHKKTCNKLSKATWSAMPFGSTSLFGIEDGAFVSSQSLSSARINTTTGTKPKKGEEEVPPNEHGDNPFLIKAQYNGSPHMMVYDRTRALETYFNRDDNPTLFEQIAELVREKGFMGMKIYLWAKRTGDFELSLALDKVPNQNVPW